jgi:hypothetical protein
MEPRDQRTTRPRDQGAAEPRDPGTEIHVIKEGHGLVTRGQQGSVIKGRQG